ncbi:hypothetical protein [Bacillus marinisedimentorum]|uniref:hypothetical protein n=1 Tax=Bacillus marinisedimentorum TaxID=1821260 RepID=UPI0007DEC71E|nr:hypothetical protein [Bacillus marinisedimentorum]
MANQKMMDKLIEIVENQLNTEDPKCTKETYDRLMQMGYTKERAKKMIAAVLVEEMSSLMKNQEPFNEQRYGEKLAEL